LTRDNALDHVFGYTIFNDFSARDTQMQERPLSMGPMKGKDSTTATCSGLDRDQRRDRRSAHAQHAGAVNGERWGGGNSRDMHHKFNDIITFHIALGDTLSRRGDCVRHGANRLRPRSSAVPLARTT